MSKAKTAKRAEIKVLSAKQPWADLILMGRKWCENRTWRTHHRGRLHLHASSWDVPGRRWLEKHGTDVLGESPGGCETGAIVGVVDLVGCYPVKDLKKIRRGQIPDGFEELADLLEEFDDESWDHVHGPWCWVMTGQRFLQKPIPAKGKLNVWSHRVDPSELRPRRRFAR